MEEKKRPLSTISAAIGYGMLGIVGALYGLGMLVGGALLIGASEHARALKERVKRAFRSPLYQGCVRYESVYAPPPVREAVRGSGLEILAHDDGRTYLIRHNMSGEPELLGKIKSILRERAHRYAIYAIPFHALHPRERTEVQSVLARWWSDRLEADGAYG